MTARARRLARATCALAGMCALGACTKSPARGPAPPLVRITAHEFSYGIPETLPAGYVHVRLVNDGGFWHHALFSRLDSAQTRDGFLAEIRAGADFPRGATDMGGTPLLAPGDSSESIVRFSPGRWVALCTASGGGTWHVKAGMIAGFTVVERPGATAVAEPEDDLTMVMNDSTFVLPDTLLAGKRWVRVENRSRKWEECDILRLEPGRTIEDYWAWRKVEHRGTPRVATPVGGVADCVPGVTQWTLTDFRPGRHVLVCDMPGDSAHYKYVEVIAGH